MVSAVVRDRTLSARKLTWIVVGDLCEDAGGAIDPPPPRQPALHRTPLLTEESPYCNLLEAKLTRIILYYLLLITLYWTSKLKHFCSKSHEFFVS